MLLAQKNRNIDQWNKLVSREINPWTYGYLVFDKGGKNIHGAETASSINGAGKTWSAPFKRMKLEHFLTPYTKRKSKWIKDLNVRPETIKLGGKHRQNTQ